MMRLFAAALIFLSSLTIWSFMSVQVNPKKSTESKHSTEDETLAPGDVVELYTNNCQGCHGNRLQQFKVLETRDRSIEEIAGIIKNGKLDKGMPPFKTAFDEAQIQELSKYIKKYNYKKNRVVASKKNKAYTIEMVVDNLEIPWGLEFLANGDLLIGEKEGKLSRFSKENGLTEIRGLPTVQNEQQGGLLDLKLHPNYAENGWIYASYSYLDDKNEELNNTAIMRFKLDGETIVDREDIYKATPTVEELHHFGSRIVFDKEGYLYFSVGDRGSREKFPQSLKNSNGKIHRINDDGSIPKDNPFVGEKRAIESIFTYGHRNPQGLAVNPVTGDIWQNEHGPQGGDEINLIKKGSNYGWPVVSYGVNYGGSKFTNLTQKEGMESPLHYYVPSIGICGMTFITSDKYPGWKNNLLVGSLSFKYLERIVVNQNRVVFQEKLLEELNSRVRTVKIGPDGYIYVTVEGPGRILRLLPKESNP